MEIRKKFVGLASKLLLAGTLLMPNLANAGNVRLDIENHVSTEWDRLGVIHFPGGSEGDEGYDSPYSESTHPVGWNPKIVTVPYGVELEADIRPIESSTAFNSNLSIDHYSGQTISGQNSWTFNFINSAPFTGADPIRHYTVQIQIPGDYISGGQDFNAQTNIRDVISGSGVLQGPNLLNVPDEVTYGTLDIHNEFNTLEAIATGPGSTSTNKVTHNYQDSTNRTATANTGTYPNSYLDYVVEHRTGNNGGRTVVTNDVIDETVTSTNYPINQIMGSNSVEFVFSEGNPDPILYDLNVVSTNKYGATIGNPTGAGSYFADGTATSTVANVSYSPTKPGERYRNPIAEPEV